MRFFRFSIILAKYDYGAVDNYIRITSVRMRANDLSHSLSFMNKANVLFFVSNCVWDVYGEGELIYTFTYLGAPQSASNTPFKGPIR